MIIRRIELTEELAGVLDTSRQEARLLLETILEAMTHALQNGEAVKIRGFGTFSVHRCPARQRRNPRTGATVAVPERMAFRFRPGKELKQLLLAPARGQNHPG
jgi:nucleoid DNA-binding protein